MHARSLAHLVDARRLHIHQRQSFARISRDCRYSSPVDYANLVTQLRAHRISGRFRTYGAVRENGQNYPLYRIDTTGFPRVVITAGFHGEEPAGPLTIAERLTDIVKYARARKIGLTIFPCINPSGFEAGTRYNQSGERPNNDFLRYRLHDGSVVGVLRGRSPPFQSFRIYTGGPKETRLLRRELQRVRTPRAALDLHQDDHLKRTASYMYVFGAAENYTPITQKSKRHLPIASNTTVDPGLKTDRHGFIWFHDGSNTDWFMRRGTPFCAVVETTTHSPMKSSIGVNWEWIKGFIDLAARGPRET